jgi:phospholipid/cholesterol/gamma-HCH transport system ATP-binding protein
MKRMAETVVLLDEVWCRLGERQVLAGATLSVGRGEIVAVVGLSGVGKSTLLKVIAGLLPIERGQLVIFGEDTTRLSEREWNERLRWRMGFVFQGGALFDWLTVAENIAFPLLLHRDGWKDDAIRQRVNELLEAVGLEGTENLLPEQLSGGMRKRVAIARALAAQPELVLYDEPTSGLDPIMSGAINDLIRKMRDRFGVTEIVVTHDIQSALRFADRIALLHGGRIVAQAPPAEFVGLSNPTVQQFLRGEPIGPLTD